MLPLLTSLLLLLLLFLCAHCTLRVAALPANATGSVVDSCSNTDGTTFRAVSATQPTLLQVKVRARSQYSCKHGFLLDALSMAVSRCNV
jgi:hypothetical protein